MAVMPGKTRMSRSRQGAGPFSTASKTAAVNHMIAKVNDPNTYYLWGGTGPYGYDCSALVREAMAKSGFVFYDYGQARVVAMPEAFAAKFPRVNRID